MTLVLNNLGAKVYGYALNPISKPNFFFDDLKLKKFLKKDYRKNIINRKKSIECNEKYKAGYNFSLGTAQV